MKLIKRLLLVFVLSIFTLNTAYAACDCSDPKKLHCKMSCKLTGETSMKKSSSETKSTSEDSGESGIGGIWKKIKNFGGKKVGEPG